MITIQTELKRFRRV